MISRAVKIHINRILPIHRLKHGEEHCTLPGGHIEQGRGEPEESALIREVKEEAVLDAKIDRKLFGPGEPCL